LIIIDGVQAELGLSDVNAEDIDAIEVLKGAAASSLYGSQAANGVVSILTKRGNTMTAGEVQTDYRIETGKSLIGYVPSKSSATKRIIVDGVVTSDPDPDPDMVMDNPDPNVYDPLDQFFNPNGVKDYDWNNNEKVSTFADSWYNYPDVTEKNPRVIDCSEWDCSNIGYMKWWFSHIPYIEGINPKDRKLNNWWMYAVDYNEALRLEKQQFVQGRILVNLTLNLCVLKPSFYSSWQLLCSLPAKSSR